MEINLNDQEEGRLNFLMREYSYIEKSTCESMYQGFIQGSYFLKKQEILSRIEAHKLLDKKGLEEKERHTLWVLTNWNQRKLHSNYKNKPIKVRQDNKTEISYGNRYSSNRNRIRYPKKCRKTAWKRFYKLFPHLNSENIK